MSWNNPLLIQSFLAGAAVAANRIVKMASDTTVIQGAASSDSLIGVNNELAATASGQSLDIAMGGIAEIEAGGSITRGALLTSDSVGRAVTASEDNRVVGVALKSASSGDIIPVLLGLSGQVTDSATFVASGTIAAAALKTMNATPVELVAAPGANKAIMLVGATFFLDYASAGYDAVGASDDLTLRYTNGSGNLLATVETVGFLDATSDQVRHVFPTAAAAHTPTANAALVAHISTGEIYTAAGDSPLKYKVEYKIIDTAW